MAEIRANGRSSVTGKFGKVPLVEKRGGKVPTGTVGVVRPPAGGSTPKASPQVSKKAK
jgi:hypothetical protein